MHNDVKRGKRDVRRNLIGLKRTPLLLSQSHFVHHLGNRVGRHYEKGPLKEVDVTRARCFPPLQVVKHQVWQLMIKIN